MSLNFGFFRSRAEPEPTEPQSFRDELNELRTRVERLELDSAERQVSVLNAIEKTMTQLRAREAKREREKASQDDVESTTNGDGDVSQHPPNRAPTSAHLARRFRGF